MWGAYKMKYKDVIELYEYFQPVYDITSEYGNYWKQFIPTKTFLETLKRFLGSLEAEKGSPNRKSIWIQGAYGTGKSHATGVIKHLLWDDLEEIEDFIEKIDDVQLREKLRSFRRENKVFPVTLKGVSGISDPKTLSLAIEEAVKEALKREGIEVRTQSEFERYIEKMYDDSINWDKIIEKNIELKALVGDLEGLLRELKNRNVDVLRALDRSWDLNIPHPKIENWLGEVLKELQGKGISSIAIYWDEFTPLMELSISSSILNILQNIAEKSLSENIFLLIISHRRPEQSQISNVDYEKILGRFHFIEYSMENITTFHIISNAIRKKDEKRWREVREEVHNKNPGLNRIMQKLIGIDLSLINVTKNLFPIHPYTATIATAISQYIGSSERSIFNFLYDQEKGFQKFISEYPDGNNGKEYFLTADFLWDFFLDDFERKPPEKVGPILSKYSLHRDALEKKSPHHSAIFKGILLLNLLHSFIGISSLKGGFYSPSEENIKDMFLGTSHENYVDEVLIDIDKLGYVSKTPDGLFLISLTPLPPQEINTEKEILKREYEDVTKLIHKELKDELEKALFGNILREVEFQIYWSGIKDFDLKRKFKIDFRKPHSLHIALFLSKDKREIGDIKNTIKKLIEEEGITERNLIFIISDTDLGVDNYEKIIEYLAREKVANTHSYKEEADINRDYVKRLIEDWVNKIKRGYFDVYHQNESGTLESYPRLSVVSLEDRLNKVISPKIFRFGLENIEELTKNINIWKTSHSEKVAGIFLSTNTLSELEEETKSAPYRYLRGIFMNNRGEYIVDKNLRFHNNVDIDHPTVRICREVENEIEKNKSKVFNLGDTLVFLRKPPYGLYHNPINYAVLSFALRPFVGKLYEANTGKKLTSETLKDKVVDLFKYWDNGKDKEKLEVRLGTPAEEELIGVLKEMFGLREEDSLSSIRLRIREWVERAGFPLWSLKSFGKEEKSLNLSLEVLDFLISKEKYLNENIIERSINLLKMNQTNLKPLLNKDKLKEGFVIWLKSLEEVKIEDEEVEEVIGYLRKNMQEEVVLWKEDKVIIKLKDWEKIREKTKNEREFISSLEEIFNIQTSKTQEDLREKIKARINDLGYPLWLLRYVLRVEIGEALKNIEDFIKRERKLSEEILKESLENIRPYESLLSKNLSTDVLKEGFSQWVKEKSVFNIDLDSFYSYLKANLNKDPYQWGEKDLEDTLRKYEFSKKLSEVFDVDLANSITELRENIKKKVQDSLYPFWSFSLLEGDEEYVELVEEIINFLTSIHNLDISEIERLSKMINRKGNSLKEAIKEQRSKELFLKWLEDILGFNENVDEIADEVRRSMSAEDYYWNKDKVENWIRRNLGNLISERKKERVKEKIKTTQKDLREILIELIDKYPQICSILEDILK